MEWLQVLTIAGSVVSAVYFTHRETMKEMKDFHGRLCALEQKYIDMMQRVLEKK
jgi:hypothetical protein